jgi:hypothetical protein
VILTASLFRTGFLNSFFFGTSKKFGFFGNFSSLLVARVSGRVEKYPRISNRRNSFPLDDVQWL